VLLLNFGIESQMAAFESIWKQNLLSSIAKAMLDTPLVGMIIKIKVLNF